MMATAIKDLIKQLFLISIATRYAFSSLHDNREHKVTLDCPEGDFKDKTMSKYVEVVNACVCTSCKEQPSPNTISSSIDNAEEENVEDNFIEDSSFNGGNSTDTLTLLLNNNSNSSSNSTTNSAFKILIAEILRDIDNDEENFLQNPNSNDMNQDMFKTLLLKLEGTNHNIMQLIKKRVEEESHVKINMKRLQRALVKLKNSRSKPQNEVLKREDISEIPGPHHSLVFTKDFNDMFASGIYSKLSPKLISSGIEQETVRSSLDVVPSYLKPATTGAEIAYYDHSLEREHHRSYNSSNIINNNSTMSSQKLDSEFYIINNSSDNINTSNNNDNSNNDDNDNSNNPNLRRNSLNSSIWDINSINSSGNGSVGSDDSKIIKIIYNDNVNINYNKTNNEKSYGNNNNNDNSS